MSADADQERAAWHAAALVGAETPGPVCLVQCGRASPAAGEAARLLARAGRRSVPLVAADRATAKSEEAQAALAAASAAWVFADDLLAAFLAVFATPLAFALRARTREGLPTVGTAGGAVALGGLLLARRVCHLSTYHLVSGLGWAPRVLVDVDLWQDGESFQALAETVQALPQLLGLRLGAAAALRVEGTHITSVGAAPALLLGVDPESHGLRAVQVEPGATAAIAPPPFAPFDPLLSQPPIGTAAGVGDAVSAPGGAPDAPPVPAARLRRAPPPADGAQPEERGSHHQRARGDPCPLCHQVHAAGDFVELAA